MRNENITKWADLLATTDAYQAQGALYELAEEDKDTPLYCCLGLGTVEFCPDIPKVLSDSPPRRYKLGQSQQWALAPVEFMRWLGYDVPDTALIGFDVYFDFPGDLRERSIVDSDASGEGGDPSLDEETGTLAENVSAASLNDEGFTFAQIADVIRYFGLRDYA